MNYQYTVIFEIDEDDGGWVAHVPALHCHSQGETREEAEENIKEAIICCLEGFQEIGKVPPIENNSQNNLFIKSVDVQLLSA